MLFIIVVYPMEFFQHQGEFAHQQQHQVDFLPEMASSVNSQNRLLFLKPKVSKFSPRDGSAFLGNVTSPRSLDKVDFSDFGSKTEISDDLQEANRNLKIQLQECQRKLQNAEQRASNAESELRALQISMSPVFSVDSDSIEVSQLSKRLPSPRRSSRLGGNGSRRPASRNGGDESDLRFENLLLVIDDLRARLELATDRLSQKGQDVANDETDLYRFAALREQLRWADVALLDESKKKEAALSSLASVTMSCKESLRRTPQHLLPENVYLEMSHEEPSDDTLKWFQRLRSVFVAFLKKVLSLEDRCRTLEHQCAELRENTAVQQIAGERVHALDEFHGRILALLMAHDDASVLQTKPTTRAKAFGEREIARDLSSEFADYDLDSLADRNKKSVQMLQCLIHKNQFMQESIEQLTKSMLQQVALVDNVLAELRKIVRCDSSDERFFAIQRSLQFIHQELVRLDECFQLITRQPSNEPVNEENMWHI